MGQSPSSDSYNADSDGLPFYQGNADFGEDNPTPRIWCTDPKKIAEKGDILISVRAPIGAINIANEQCCIGRGVAAIRPNAELISKDFLRHQLCASRNKLEAMGTGRTFKAIGKKALNDLAIAIYPKREQEAIACQFNWVAEQTKGANSQLALLDSLVKSQFVEMFGGALSIENKWDSSILKNCVESLESGKSPSCKNISRKGSNPGVLKLSALSSGRFLPGENKAMLDGETIIQTKEVKQGDILVARKNTPQLVGSCVLVREDVTNLMFPDIVFRMHPNDSVNGEYLAALLSSPSYSSKVRGLAHGSNKSMSNIPKSELAKLSIPLPPLPLQQEFADFVAQVDKSRFVACFGWGVG